MDEDRVKLVHAAVVAMVTSPEFVDALVKKVLAVASENGAQQAANNARDKICPSCHGSGTSYCGIGLEMGTCLSCNGTGKLS